MQTVPSPLTLSTPAATCRAPWLCCGNSSSFLLKVLKKYSQTYLVDWVVCFWMQVYPDKGTVCFSAGLHGWAFTLTVFAKLYAKKVGCQHP